MAATVTPQVAAIAAAQRAGTHPERLTALAMPAAFDAVAWDGDPAYRQRYLSLSEPGRVWQTAPPAADGTALRAAGERHLQAKQGDPVALRVIARPGDPVSFSAFEGGVFQESETNAVTVAANAEGVATAHFVAYAGTTDDCAILAASPRCIGPVTFQVFILGGRP